MGWQIVEKWGKKSRQDPLAGHKPIEKPSWERRRNKFASHCLSNTCENGFKKIMHNALKRLSFFEVLPMLRGEERER
jgi:hypothetical protein